MDDIPVAPLDDGPRKGPPGGPHGRGPLPAAEPPRRSFLYQCCAAAIGGAVAVVPLAAGVAVYLDPLRHKKAAGGMLPVAKVTKLPDAGEKDALIGLVKITADRKDAWNLYRDEPVGAVYLVVPKGTAADQPRVKALNATCPHLGCFVDLQQAGADYSFKCPCHTSAFTSNGSRIEPCVSPRDMDDLPCEVVKVDDGYEIRVAFQNFQPGLEQKKPKT